MPGLNLLFLECVLGWDACMWCLIRVRVCVHISEMSLRKCSCSVSATLIGWFMLVRFLQYIFFALWFANFFTFYFKPEHFFDFSGELGFCLFHLISSVSLLFVETSGSWWNWCEFLWYCGKLKNILSIICDMCFMQILHAVFANVL